MKNIANRPSMDALDQYEEIALATAQADMETTIEKAGLQKSVVASIMGRPKSFISKIMGGGHNLTIRTMARLYAACGLELRFGKVAVVEHWVNVTVTAEPPPIASAVGGGAEGRADATKKVACAEPLAIAA